MAWVFGGQHDGNGQYASGSDTPPRLGLHHGELFRDKALELLRRHLRLQLQLNDAAQLCHDTFLLLFVVRYTDGTKAVGVRVGVLECQFHEYPVLTEVFRDLAL
jgi:hypothetical protein